MLPKPDGCRGCSFWGSGQGFVPDEIRPGAQAVLWAQGPGESEERGQRYLGKDSTGQEQWEAHPPAPLIGKTGRLLGATFLPLAGLNREDVSLANSVRCRWNHQNTLPPLTQKVIQAAIKHCTLAHWKPQNTLLYVAMGEFATYTLTGLLHGFNGWRGYLLPKRHPWEPPQPMTGIWTPGPKDAKVFVTYHPAMIFRDGGAELPAKRDWNKVPQILNRKWPEPYPGHETNPEKLVWAPGSAFDTEYREDTGQLIRFSVANPDRKVFVIEWQDMIRYRGEGLQRILPHTSPPIPVYPVWPSTNTQCQNQGVVPSMLPAGLCTVGQETQRASVSPQESSLSLSQMQGTLAARTRVVEDRIDGFYVSGYGTVPRCSLLNLQQSKEVGPGPRSQDWEGTGPSVFAVQPRHWLNGGRLNLAHFSGLIPLTLVGHNVVVDAPYLGALLPPGTVFDLSCSMYSHSCLWTGKVETDDQKGKSGGAMSHSLNFLGSMYARFNRWKHLSHTAPKTYAGGDALGTMDVWETGLHGGLSGELDRDPQSRWVYENLQKPLIPLILKMRQRGIAVDQEAAKRALTTIRGQQTTLSGQAQAYAGWPLNLRSPAHVSFWLYQVEKLKVRRFGRR